MFLTEPVVFELKIDSYSGENQAQEAASNNHDCGNEVENWI